MQVVTGATELTHLGTHPNLFPNQGTWRTDRHGVQWAGDFHHQPAHADDARLQNNFNGVRYLTGNFRGISQSQSSLLVVSIGAA
jgi:hypothetical protein